jgi:phage shock protein PspC (stress-responsive transcriptional regulator)
MRDTPLPPASGSGNDQGHPRYSGRSESPMITGMEPETPNQPTPAGDTPDAPAGDQPDTPPAAAHDPADDAPTDPPPPPPPPPPGSEPAGGGGGFAPSFQFLRSRRDRKVGGVAGGLAAAAGLDPTLVRLAIVLGLLTGWGVLAYLIAWAIIPEEDPARGRYLVPAPERTARHIRIVLTVIGVVGVLHVVGAILGVLSAALIGIGLFPAHIFGLNHGGGFQPGEALLGLLLLIGGMLLVFRHHLPWMPTPDTGPGSGPAPAGPKPPPSTMALATIDPGSGGGATYGPPPPPPGPGGSSGSPGWADFGARASEFGARASAAARSARTNGPLLLVRAIGWLAALWFLIALLVGGVFWVTGALHVRLPLVPIVTSLAALGVLGYTLVRSRRLGAVIGATALLAVPTGLVAALTRVDGQAGDRSVTPIAVSDLEPRYRHSVGELDLDLSRLQIPAGSRTPINISMGVGRIEVVVPWDADVESKASVGAGTFELFGNRQTGVNLNGRTHSTSQPGAPVLVISGKAGVGEVVVRRASEPFTHEALRTGQPVPVQCTLFPSGAAATGPVSCAAADGVTQTPAMTCVVAAKGFGLCRPTGEPEPAVDYANDPGTRHCQIPAGGGESTCTPPVAGRVAPSGGSFTCTIPEGGGPATCSPAKAGGKADPNAPAEPRSPAEPADPNAPANSTPPATAAPGEYRCTVPEGGGPATCEPA